MIGAHPSAVRAPYHRYHTWYESDDADRIRSLADEAEVMFRRTGITFNGYGDDEADERLIPFDVVPRSCRQTSGANSRVASPSASER